MTTTYSYNVPLDWQKVLNEIQHRLTQAYGRLHNIEIRRPCGRTECFYKGENEQMSRFLFNIAITDKIVRIVIQQLHDNFILQLDTETDCKGTNISPELMEYLVKILNKAARELQLGRKNKKKLSKIVQYLQIP